jgi:hypothetical protein
MAKQLCILYKTVWLKKIKIKKNKQRFNDFDSSLLKYNKYLCYLF